MDPVYRGRQRQRPGWTEAPAPNPQRPDQQPDRQVEVLLHLQNLPASSRFSLQHLWQLCRWGVSSEPPAAFQTEALEDNYSEFTSWI